MGREKIVVTLGTLLFLLAAAMPVRAVQVVIDKPVKAGELTLFPGIGDQNVYYYVSDKVSLATHANGKPQFSFLRYVQNVQPGVGEPEAREGSGGGIVHALVMLGVSPEQLSEAQRELQRVKPGARIEGPVIYKSGKFGIISSFTDADGKLTNKVVGIGNAPILDGEKAAISIHLTKEGAKILWESFNTPTPDISFSFEMEIDGYLSPHRALIVANFDQIYQHQAFGVGIASTYLSAEIKGAFDDLRRTGAIRLEQVGDDEDLEKLITTAYNKITEMMFSPMGSAGGPSIASVTSATGGGRSLLDKASTLLTNSRKEARAERDRLRREETARTTTSTGRESGTPTSASRSSAESEGSRVPASRRGTIQPPRREPRAAAEASRRRSDEVTVPSIAVVAAYEIKRVRQRGTFRIDLNKYTTDRLTLRFDENIGDLREHRNDDTVFRQVNLDDPLYRQREIAVMVDGLNADDFGNYVNFVNVLLQKVHENRDITNEEVNIKRDSFNSEGNRFSLLYGWKGDQDRRRWLDYRYKTVWSFFGGGTVEQPWADSNAGAINLAPPYLKQAVMIEADPLTLQDAGVRAVDVRIYYDLAGVEQVKRVLLRPSQNKFSDTVDVILPAGQLEYEYEVTWMIRNKPSAKLNRTKTSDSILFVDEIPGS